MDSSRRRFLRGAAFVGAGLAAAGKTAAQHQHQPPEPAKPAPQKPLPGVVNPPASAVQTPDVPHLAWQWDNGVKVFELIAEPVCREFLPASSWSEAKLVDAWGFNGSVPGPTIEVNEGDRVRIVVENRLPEITSMHWHGLEVPIEMDGVPGISQEPIPSGGRFIYEFTLNQHGTFFYHSHMAMQEMMGMIGLFIIHPKTPYAPRVDKDFGIILQEWAILPNNTVPNTMAMEFNWLTLNGKAGPATTPLIVRQGERVRIRFVNLGMDHHPMHLHGHQFFITGTEGGRIPESAWYPTNTVLVGVAQAKVVEFDAKYTGDWMLHCHLPHHMMNQMASMVGPLAGAHQGMHTGMGMKEGMGMLRKGHALSEESGPSLGRTLGFGSDSEQATSNMVPQQPQHAQHAQRPGELVPGYPQDMFLLMDEAVVKPETYGLRAGWTGAMMGMMTLVRVLQPELYEKVQALQKQASVEHDNKAAGHKHAGQ